MSGTGREVGGRQLRPKLPPLVKSLGAVSFLNDLASEMLYPLLPALVTRGLGAGAVTLGLLDGLSDAGSSLAKLGSGWFSDRRGWRRPLVVAGYAVAAAARPVIGLATAGWQVVLLRSVDRLGKGARTPPRDALIADAAAEEMRGRAFGFHRAMDHAGAVAGPLIATLLLAVAGLGPREVILWTALPGALAVGTVWWALYAGKGPARVEPPVPNSEMLLRDPPPTGRPAGVLFWLIVLFAFSRMPETLMLLRLQDLGLPVALAPVLWALLHVVRTAASYPGGHLADRLGPGRVMVLGWLFYVSVCAGLAGATSAAAGAVWFALFGLVAAATEPAERAYVAAMGGAGKRGRAFGKYHAAVGVAALPGGWVLGTIYDEAGGAAALGLSGALAGALAVVFLLKELRVRR
ncbi:Inner membrane transport protein YajR [bacterium HR33]|nr:Inner membrane transport protein YajR [bacterium HR33]